MTSEKASTIYWDSSCFCAWFSKEPNRYNTCNAIIEAAQKEQVKLHTSYLTLTEVIRIPNEYPSEAEDVIAEFFKNPYITMVTLDWPVTRITRDLRRRFKHLDCRDAIHLGTAIRMKVDVLHTYDHDDLTKLDDQIPGYSLRITEPVFDYQTKLPLAIEEERTKNP